MLSKTDHPHLTTFVASGLVALLALFTLCGCNGGNAAATSADDTTTAQQKVNGDIDSTSDDSDNDTPGDGSTAGANAVTGVYATLEQYFDEVTVSKNGDMISARKDWGTDHAIRLNLIAISESSEGLSTYIINYRAFNQALRPSEHFDGATTTVTGNFEIYQSCADSLLTCLPELMAYDGSASDSKTINGTDFFVSSPGEHTFD